MKTYLLAAVAAVALGGSAFAGDWKEYGSVDASNGGAIPSMCFLDKNTLYGTPDGHVRVWTKCVAKDAFSDEAIGPETTARGKKIVDAGAFKQLRGYTPPIATIGVGADANDAILAETVADLDDVEPTQRVLAEIDCRAKMVRRLDTYQITPSRIHDDSEPGHWRPVREGTPIANLYDIACVKLRG